MISVASILRVGPMVLVVALIVLAGGGFFVLRAQAERMEVLRAELKRAEAQISAANARYRQIIEKRDSDNVVDQIPDGDLRDVPADWLLPPTDDDSDG